jgi:serralysin
MALIEDGRDDARVIGTPEDDVIWTFGARVLVQGRAGDDEINATEESTLLGGAGDDTLNGGLSPVLIYGGDGADRMSVGTGLGMKVYGGRGFDVLYVESYLSTWMDSRIAGVERVELAERSVVRLVKDDVFNHDGSTKMTFDFVAEGVVGSSTVDIRFTGHLDASGLIVEGMEGYDSVQLFGADGDQRIIGSSYRDVLEGLGGDDTLRGGEGDDWLAGGAGDDLYFVETMADSLDGELVGLGRDTVVAMGDYRLAAGAEIEVLRTLRPGETTALDLVGNEFSNLIAGNDGANVLRGGRGEDTLLGHDGGDRLVGSDGNDVLAGQAGDDVLDSGRGADRLSGGEGADRFLFRAVGASAADVRGQDTIVDFERADGDVIDLSMIDADLATARDDAFRLVDGPFTGAAGELRVVASAKGALLLGDVDGDGAAEFGLFVSGQTAMTEADFAL